MSVKFFCRAYMETEVRPRLKIECEHTCEQVRQFVACSVMMGVCMYTVPFSWRPVLHVEYGMDHYVDLLDVPVESMELAMSVLELVAVEAVEQSVLQAVLNADVAAHKDAIDRDLQCALAVHAARNRAMAQQDGLAAAMSGARPLTDEDLQDAGEKTGG